MNVTFALENWSIWCCIKSSVPPLAVSAAIAERFTSSLKLHAVAIVVARRLSSLRTPSRLLICLLITRVGTAKIRGHYPLLLTLRCSAFREICEENAEADTSR